MAKRNRQFGDWGERLAERYLSDKGYEILGRNFQRRCGEIDLICHKDGSLHFVEVKTRTLRSVERFGPPQDAVTTAKRRKLIETALTYLSEKGDDGNTAWQIDVISIVYAGQKEEARLEFIENAVGEE
jgi:putative endonuclease